MRYVFLIVILLAPAPARAAQPLGVEDTATEGRGNFLLEINGDYKKDNEFKTTDLTGIFTAGISAHADISIETPYLMLDPSPALGQKADGIGDVRLKLKSQIFENEVKQSMAYVIFIDMPTGDVSKGLGTNNVVWGVKLIDSQQCRSCVFHLNVGFEAFTRDTTNHAVTFSLAAGHKMTESFRLMTQIAGEIRKSRKESDQYSRPLTLLAGVIYDLSKSWYVDLGARAGLNKYAEDYALLAGTAWRF